MTTAEHRRLGEADAQQKKWRRWGTYLSERQWGTVREDYSAGGDAWGYLPFDDAHTRAYRWGEDGLLGLSDNRGLVCFSVALWNGQDPILKERLFGLSGPEGNHGEDVKECYFYLDATPTHSYAHGLYKYPQRRFPYEELRRVNREAGRDAKEIDLVDTGIFDEDRYFDVDIVYAKADVDDVLIDVRVTNRGPEPAPLTVLPTFFVRNTWSWGEPDVHPRFVVDGPATLAMDHYHLGELHVAFDGPDEVVLTENESNKERLWGAKSEGPHTKDAFHRYVVHGQGDAVSRSAGSKAAAVHTVVLAPGETRRFRARLSSRAHAQPFGGFDETQRLRKREADEFYDAVLREGLTDDQRHVSRQALAGVLWTKQFYHLDINRWLRGDPGQPTPPASRLTGRNSGWGHLYNSEVISMPDKWEYPWYAAWDTAFHAVPLSIVDPELAKAQISIFLREWYMHPNGQIPAYEWSFSDVNPPVQAWAALRLYQMEVKRHGEGDRAFLESVFHKLMLNFTWWVNRKDAQGHNVFEGGFMGLDNIGVFDRSSALPTGGRIEQADATSWMGMYCLDLLAIALELAKENSAYEDVANKFFEHFLYIAHAASRRAGDGVGLWDEQDGFFYDVLNLDGDRIPLRVRSMVGLIPLYAVRVLDTDVIARFPGFMRRMKWFLKNRPELAATVAHVHVPGEGEEMLLSLVSEAQLRRVLARMLDETEFLSQHGVRALSRFHLDHPYVFHVRGKPHRVDYEPAESRSFLFGGNSNWRGPVWFPVNFLLLESLRKLHDFYGDRLRVECPTGSGRMMHLGEVADELSRRLSTLFLRDEGGARPALGEHPKAQRDPHFRDHVLFYEYFHAETGAGLGAAHQTGWTALVATLLAETGR
ncbi:MAG: glucosidase [Polyangiaceae bacterium]|nr:glucosidase [Polyangiaceae bacterium]